MAYKDPDSSKERRRHRERNKGVIGGLEVKNGKSKGKDQ